MYSHLNYVRRGKKSLKQKAVDTLIYNGCRPGKDQEEMLREYFGHGGKLTPEQAMKMILEASPHTMFWRLILNPDPLTEDPNRDLDLHDLTAEMVRWLERRIGRVGEIDFIAALHDDHTKLRHIHALLLIERHGREKLITNEILDEFRLEAQRRALERLGMDGQQMLALMQGGGGEQRQQEPPPPAPQASTLVKDGTSTATPKPMPITHDLNAEEDRERVPFISIDVGSAACPNCNQGLLIRQPNSRAVKCSYCGIVLKNGQVLRKRRELEWSL